MESLCKCTLCEFFVYCSKKCNCLSKFEVSYESFLKTFKTHVSKLGLKNSIQKDYILKILYYSRKHLKAEEIVDCIKLQYNVEIGIATVYRSMKFLEKMNIINSLDAGDGSKRYELTLSLHHDHLICTSCYEIIEFTDDVIEEKQKIIAKHFKYILTNHVMTIYGLCKNCQ